MSKPDPMGESLESILASIRRSLAEQSTDVLNDEPAPQPDAAHDPELIAPGEGDVPRLFGGAGTDPAQVEAALAGQPAGRRTETPTPPSLGDVVPTRGDAPARSEAAARSEMTQRSEPASAFEESPPPAPASLAAASVPAPSQDPFWFLSRRGEVVETKDSVQSSAPAPRPQPAPPSAPARAAEPKPQRTEIVRGPLPPFFGSSAEAPKTEVMPMPGAAIVPNVAMPARMLDAPQPPPRESAPEPPTRVPEAPAAPAAPAAVPRDALPNGKLPPLFGPAPADPRTAAADGSAQIKGLEAMVAELLRPMLRRWLDENMPRLVSAALKAEAENIAKRDPKKP